MKETLKQILKDAQKNHYAIGQFNFSTLEQLRGIFEAADELESPVILGTSEGESKFLGLEETVALTKILRKKHKIPVFLHLDHGKDFKWIKKAVDLGYDSVHFDGSALTLEENIKQIKQVIKYARKKGIFIEGELGAIKGESSFHKGKIKLREKDFALVADVKKFVEETGVDSLAIAIGSTHGIYKEEAGLDFKRLRDIRKETDVPLVLHGGSGIPDEEIKKAIKFGISKINFNTEIRLCWKNGLEKVFKKMPGEAKPYKILLEVQNLIKIKVAEKIKLLNA